MIQQSHKNSNIYKMSIEMVTEVYNLTKKFPGSEKYNLTSQLRRAAVSIPSNIAEGSSRTSNVEKKRFYQISRSSLVELDTQFEIALKLNYLDSDELIKLSDLSHQTFAMLTKMMK